MFECNVGYDPKEKTPLAFAKSCVGNGWSKIIEETHNKLLEIDPDFSYAQVKEKFGCLRIYADPSKDLGKELNNKFFNICWDAEQESSKLCEDCGSEDNVETKSTRYWIRTLCPICRLKEFEHFKKQEAEARIAYPFLYEKSSDKENKQG